MDIDVVVDFGNEFGENPLWDGERGKLYWCEHDFDSSARLFSFDVAVDEARIVHETGYVGGFTLNDDGSLLLFKKGNEIARLDTASWHEETVREDPLPGEDPAMLFNDVAADPAGRVFCGTRYLDERDGALHRVDPDGSVHRVLDGVQFANGIAFSPNEETVYFADSFARTVSAYEYDVSDGSLRNPETVRTVPEDEGVPDGIAVDEDGAIWVAHAFGGQIGRYSPSGDRLTTVDVPVGLVTNLAFGRPGLDWAYVTTGGGQDKAEHGESAGALFSFDPGVRGRPGFRSSIDFD